MEQNVFEDKNFKVVGDSPIPPKEIISLESIEIESEQFDESAEEVDFKALDQEMKRN